MSSFRPPRLRLSEEKRALLARLLAEQGHHVSHAERIPRRAGGTSAPLSFAQQRLWFLDQWSPGRATYNSGGVLRLSGPLNVCALAQAVAEIARRHESLRTVFSLADELPVQTVNPPAPPSLPLADLARLKARELQTQEERLTAAESRRPFELAAGPLLRVWLLRLAADEHVCLLVMHHIVSDGWSVGVLMRELSALYDSFRAGLPSPLAELPIQYADYAAWQRERLSGELLAPSLDFWRRQLNPPPVPLELPTARPRPPVQTFEGARRAFDLGPELTCALKELARAEEATPFMVLLAAFQTLLYRYTGQEDVCVGTPVAGRRQLETEPLIGCFVNTLVMRTSLGGDPSFTELLARVRQTSLAAFAHAELPYERLVEELQPQRDTSRNPLFQVMLVLQNTPPPEFNLAGLRVTPRDLDSGASRFDLTLFLTETGGQLRCALEYNSDLFDAPFIARLTGHFEHLLAAATADRTVPVSALSLLTSAERHQLVREWNDTAAPDPTPLLHLLLARLRSAPDAIALVRGDDHLSLSALHARARALARRLRAAGTGPDSLVALCLSRSPAMVEALLGVLYSGAAYLPLDPEHPAERLALVLSDARPSVLVTERGLRPLVAACGATADGAAVIELDAEPEGEHDAHVPDAHTPAASLAFDSARSLAYVIYTSGTTGRPKGVEVERRSLDLFLASMAVRPGLCSADVLLAVTTLSFDIAGLELWLPLREGARLELATEPEARDGARLAALLRERRVSVLQATPSTWRLLAQEWAGVSGAAATGGVSGAAAGLRALCGGEAWSSALAEALLAAGCAQVWNVYGPTETTIWSAARRVRRGERVVAAGGPLMRTQLYVLDGRGEVAPEGAWGQLWIGGGGLARGYRGRAELTAERFRPDGLSGECGGRVYQTGDVARVPCAGVVEVGGRGDEQVKVRGHRVELGEVEAALVRHGAVREGAAVVRAGVGGEMELVGYVVWAAGAGGGVGEGVGACGGVGATAVELREHMRVLVPEYMVPGRYVAVGELPLTPNGKLDRKRLPAPEDAAIIGSTTYAAASTELERQLVGIWREVLQVPQVGVKDNFFDLGGHSLLAAQVRGKIKSVLGIDLPIVELFRHPTITALAEHLGRTHDAPPSVGLSLPRARREARTATDAAVAVIGMALRFPGADSPQAFWRNLRAGTESVVELSDDELLAAGVPSEALSDPRYVKRAVPLAGAEQFDAAFFGMSPREAALTDPQQRLLLECAWEAVEAAGYDSVRAGGRVGVFAGAGLNRYLVENLLPVLGGLEDPGGMQAWLGNERDFVATRVAYKLDMRGPAVSVATACSTSLVAVHMACQSLLSGECEAALAGGVSVRVPTRTGYWSQAGGITSPDGHCRAFDRRAAGTLFGSGVGVVFLKPLSKALADGDRIRAVIRGTAVNNDGSRKVGYTAPSVAGQAAVIAEALEVAGVHASDVTYIEAHGTGTELGDPVEVAALAEVYGRGARCALGSVKANFGHLDAAAGVAGLIKAVLQLERGELAPQINFEEFNPEIGPASEGFYVNTKLSEWKTDGRRRVAGVSSFGIGGTNAHVIVEEPPVQAASESTGGPQLLLLSAKTEGALDKMTAALAARLGEGADESLADVAYTLQVGRKQFGRRRVVVGRDARDAAEALRERRPGRVFTGVHEGGARPVAFMFPGQGTQHVNMGRDLYRAAPVFREWVDRCSELLAPELGFDLRTVLYPSEGEEATARERLRQTRVTQPALFVTEYALAKLYESWGVVPTAMIGHSLGEYVAACLAGVFSLEDALAAVAARGRLMQEMPEGAMLAVTLPRGEVEALLGDGLWLAAVNAPSLCVVSGTDEAVRALEARLSSLGVAHRRLEVSHAFHSGLMDAAVESFAALMRGVRLNAPRTPFVSNLTGGWISDEEATDPSYWARHLRQTVRFGEGVGRLLGDGGTVLLEVGFGRTLTKLVGARTDLREDQVVLASLDAPHGLESEDALLLGALGRLWLAGVEPDWAGLHTGQRRRRVELPTYPFERQRYWVDGRRERAAGGVGRQSSTGRKQDAADWFYVPSWRQTAAPHLVGAEPDAAADSPWLVLLDECGLGEALVERLRGEGHAVVTARGGEHFSRVGEGRYTIDATRREHYEALLGELSTGGMFPRRVVHLLGVTREGRGEDDAAFRSLLPLAQALGERLLVAAARDEGDAAPLGLAVVTNNMQQVTGADRVEPSKALALGPCKVFAQEYPNAVCRSIDIELAELRGETIEQLLGELAAADDERVVAHRGGRRWVQTFEPVRLARGAARGRGLREGGVYLITGGLGGVGLALAGELARRARAKLILVGRSAFPERGEWRRWAETHSAQDEVGAKIARLLALEEAGAEVFYAQADVADFEGLRAAVERGTSEFGPVNGVIHAAGTPPHGLMQHKTSEAVAAALAAKVAGTKALLALFEGAPLDFMLLCSSVRALTGGPGSSDYAAANAFLDAVAQQSGRRRVMSVNWDGWKGVGMAAHAPLQDGLRLETEGGLSEADGVEAFGRLLSCGLPQVIVSTCDLGALVEESRRFNVVAAATATTTARAESARSHVAHPRPEVSASYVAPRTEAERALADIWQRLLGIEPIGVDDNFFELGGDSTISIQVMAEAHRAGLALMPKQIFECQTVAELARVATTPDVVAARETPDSVAASEDDLADFGWGQEHFEEMLSKVRQTTGTGAEHEQ